jgi:flagellar protein FlaG
MNDYMNLAVNTQLKAAPKVNRPTVQNVQSINAPAPKAEAKESDNADARKTQIDQKQLNEAAQSVADHLQSHQRTLQFSLDSETNQPVVRVIDKETQELIRQIPSEELVTISRRLEAATGVLLQDKA